MSITLMAYPMAFLTAPEKAPAEQLHIKEAKTEDNVELQTKNLKYIRVLTNIKFNEWEFYKQELNLREEYGGWYADVNTDMLLFPEVEGKFVTFTVLKSVYPQLLQQNAEQFFKQLDGVVGRNVRLLGDKEIFYYNYETEFTDYKEIYKTLKQQKATQIFTDENGGIVANLNGKNIRYFRGNEHNALYHLHSPESDGKWMVEIEQKITIMNIGVDENTAGRYSSYAMTSLKIPTNIKKNELKKLLKAANYGFYPANGNTPLRNSYVTLNWIEKDGYYTADFSGNTNNAIIKEAETVFRKLNIAAGRDLRLINDTATAIYTYNTNYTDKGVLLNTLYEHGAEEIEENGETVTCKLFNMEMKYYKQENGAYCLEITQISDKTECENVINDLNEEYGLNMQEITYNKIKERLEQENLRLESESVLEDNSVVLTIEI